MAKQVRSPLDGRPLTTPIINDRGETGYFIRAEELTPLRAILADGASSTGCLFAVLEGGLFLSAMDVSAPPLWIAALTGPVLLYKRINRFVRGKACKTTAIEMSRTRFRYQTKDGWEELDRTVPHRFLLRIHRQAKNEKKEHDRKIQEAALEKRIITKRPYYGESYHLIYEYLGHPHEIMEIYGPEQAQQVFARLKACDGLLDRDNGANDGISLDPETQWGRQPGDIPMDGPKR